MTDSSWVEPRVGIRTRRVRFRNRRRGENQMFAARTPHPFHHHLLPFFPSAARSCLCVSPSPVFYSLSFLLFFRRQPHSFSLSLSFFLLSFLGEREGRRERETRSVFMLLLLCRSWSRPFYSPVLIHFHEISTAVLYESRVCYWHVSHLLVSVWMDVGSILNDEFLKIRDLQW